MKKNHKKIIVKAHPVKDFCPESSHEDFHISKNGKIRVKNSK